MSSEIVEKGAETKEVAIDDKPEPQETKGDTEEAKEQKELAAISKRAIARSRRENAADSWKKNYNPCCWGISCLDYLIFFICFGWCFCVQLLIMPLLIISWLLLDGSCCGTGV